MCLTTIQPYPEKASAPVKCYKIVNYDKDDMRLSSFYFGYTYRLNEVHTCSLFGLYKRKEKTITGMMEYGIDHGFHAYKSLEFAENVAAFCKDTYHEPVAIMECEIPEDALMYTGVDGFSGRAEEGEDATCYCSSDIIVKRWKPFGNETWIEN